MARWIGSPRTGSFSRAAGVTCELGISSSEGLPRDRVAGGVVTFGNHRRVIRPQCRSWDEAKGEQARSSAPSPVPSRQPAASLRHPTAFDGPIPQLLVTARESLAPSCPQSTLYSKVHVDTKQIGLPRIYDDQLLQAGLSRLPLRPYY